MIDMNYDINNLDRPNVNKDKKEDSLCLVFSNFIKNFAFICICVVSIDAIDQTKLLIYRYSSIIFCEFSFNSIGFAIDSVL